jgi:hypothetical protein
MSDNIENLEGLEDFPLTNAMDVAILMHRDAHFGGRFDLMLEYYAKGGKGVNPDFDIDRIILLSEMEKKINQNLAALLLSGPDAERVAQAKEAYKKLRDLYETEKPYNKIPLLIADLILSESEEPIEEIDEIVKEKGLAVKPLLELIRSEDFHDPLFPGYGLAPNYAVTCLGLIGDKRAIVTLFESIGSGDFFDEDMSLAALHAIGDPAKAFLMKVLHGKPLNIDNEKAAIALINFKEDPEVSAACLNMLRDPEVRRQTLLATYLVLACEGLTDEGQRKDFMALMEDNLTPQSLQKDMKILVKTWE